MASIPMWRFHWNILQNLANLNLLQKFNFAQGSSVDPIFRLCPEMKEQVDIDGLTSVALNFFFGCKIKPTEIVPSEIEQPRKWTLKK